MYIRNLYRIRLLRRIVLPFLKMIDRDIKIRHPWIDGMNITISLFKHKGYWFHGNKREKETMQLFKEIIRPDSIVVEIGGHIGFISVWFENLTGPNGKVYVFEPGSNNLPYIRKNIELCERIELIEKAVGSTVGTVDFYEDNLTGQNNSVVKDFDGFKMNAEFSYVNTKVNKVSVPMTSIDSEFNEVDIDFIKIDIEGGELDALRGADNVISKQLPAMMVEIQANEDEIYQMLLNYNYKLFSPTGTPLNSPMSLKGNVFCLHKEKHKDLIKNIFIH